MSTIILGGGIIGSSIAYYLSERRSNDTCDDIHIIESSSQLFSAASGYAAGFLAKNWFAPSLAPLGALSFDLHRELAEEHGGAQKWGYMRGTALSLDASDTSKKRGKRGDDWLRAGTSRAETAAMAADAIAWEQSPQWLTRQEGGRVEKISDDDTVAQVDPLRLSQFLMESSIARGVQLHHPARAVSTITDEHTGAVTGVKILDLTANTESTIPCTNLIICGGPWTPRIFKELFPASGVSIPISPLAGYSLVVRSPRYTLEHERATYDGRSHAIFTTHPASSGFCPEIFSREGGEIYVAGLNSSEIPLPEQAEDARELMDMKEMERLKNVAVRLMGKLGAGHTASTNDVSNENDLQVLREGLCFRPVTSRGTPVVTRLAENHLHNGIEASSGDSEGRDSNPGGVFIASGHGPWGISLSLGTGKVIAEMVQGANLSADVSGLGL